jgi:predicted aspartyl protease
MISIALLAASVAVAPASNLQTTVEVPFRIADSAMIVDCAVNGKNVSVMFDSGFSGAFVLSSNVNVGKPTGTMMLRDFVGQFEAPTVKVDKLAFGGKNIDISEMQVVLQDMGDLSLSYGQHCDGIMGFEVIEPYVVEINFETQKMIFHPKEYDITQVPADGQKSFLLKMLPKGNKSIELTAEAANGQKMYLALDTGNAFYATTHKDVLERANLWAEGKKPKYVKQSWVASGPVDSWDLQFDNMKIFNVPVASSVWNIIDMPSSSADHDGTVGFGFLRHFNITIDVGRRRVRMEKFGDQVSDAPTATVGVYAVWDPGKQRMRISRVMPESPAERAGIKYGDDLLSVDGKDLGHMTFDSVQNLLDGPAGTKVAIQVSTGGNFVRYELEREVLVNKLN